ncbi:hypothetical protein AZ78_2138 [Lysobacter capsici AZ78]|uniref:Uncharacterized protein n=1 Tax=Lysobacter capsici AZ78 TaxID=1444315 RepID=A0A108U8M8_9GAMM|nr:hypothetical protein AZ78_2138 [Lysobacter capsici AZ78]
MPGSPAVSTHRGDAARVRVIRASIENRCGECASGEFHTEFMWFIN